MIYFSVVGLILITIIINIITNYRFKFLENICFFIISIFIFFMAAFRDGIGYDFRNYESIYNVVRNSYMSTDLFSIEPAYLLINLISPNFSMVIFLCAVIAIPLKIIIITKYSEDKLLSLMLYFTGIFMMYDIGVIRQGIAIAIALLSIKYLIKRSLLKFILTIVIASLFHVSAMVFLPLYILSYKKLSRKFIYASIFILLVFSYFNLFETVVINTINFLPIDMISSKINYYSSINSGDLTKSLLLRSAFLIVYVEFYKAKKINDKKSLVFLNGFFLSIVLMSVFSSIPILGGRGVAGLYFLQIFILPILIKNTRTKIFKFFIIIGIVIISVNTMLDIINQGTISNQPYIPYRSIFNQN